MTIRKSDNALRYYLAMLKAARRDRAPGRIGEALTRAREAAGRDPYSGAETCPACRGSGWHDPKPCLACDPEAHGIDPGEPTPVDCPGCTCRPCPACHGGGYRRGAPAGSYSCRDGVLPPWH